MPTARQEREQVPAAVIAASDSGYARARAVRDGMAAALYEAGLGELMYRVTGLMTGLRGVLGTCLGDEGWSMLFLVYQHGSCVVAGSTSPDRARRPSSCRSS